MCYTAGVDYRLATENVFNVTISTGSTSLKINIIDDKIQETNETFSIDISLLSTCLPLVLGTSSSTVTIIDNDGTNNNMLSRGHQLFLYLVAILLLKSH